MKFNYFAGIIALLIVFSSCKKKSDDVVTPEPEKEIPKTTSVPKYGKAIMHLHTFIGDEELDGYDGLISVPSSERRISMSVGEVHMSQFELVDMGDRIVKMSDTTLLKTPEIISYYLNKIPVGKYKALRFKVEIDTTKNTKGIFDKSESFPTKALFVGKLDTANVPDENNTRVEYSYNISNNAKTIQVALPNRVSGREFNIHETTVEYFHLYLDLNVLFAGIKLNDPKNLNLKVQEGNSELANKIATNISNMFRYE